MATLRQKLIDSINDTVNIENNLEAGPIAKDIFDSTLKKFNVKKLTKIIDEINDEFLFLDASKTADRIIEILDKVEALENKINRK